MSDHSSPQAAPTEGAASPRFMRQLVICHPEIWAALERWAADHASMFFEIPTGADGIPKYGFGVQLEQP